MIKRVTKTQKVLLKQPSSDNLCLVLYVLPLSQVKSPLLSFGMSQIKSPLSLLEHIQRTKIHDRKQVCSKPFTLMKLVHS